MLTIGLLVVAFVCFILSKIKLLPKANWMDIGFGLAALAAILELVYPSR